MRHLKVIAYVPVLGRIVRPLGYPVGWALIDVPEPAFADRVWALVRLARTYEFWVLAGLLLGVVVAVRRLRGRDVRAVLADRWMSWLAVLVVYIAAWEVLILWKFPKAFVGWFPSFAPLVAVLFGVGFARLLTLPDLSALARRIVLGALIVLLLAPMAIVRHPLLVVGGEAAPLQALDVAAAHFRRVVKPGAKVFLWGDSMPLYLAGIRPYLRQIHSTNTYALVEDRVAIEKSGLWGRKEMEEWLGRDADYVVLEPSTLDQYRERHPDHMARFDALLREHFELIDRVDEYPWQVFEIYARRR